MFPLRMQPKTSSLFCGWMNSKCPSLALSFQTWCLNMVAPFHAISVHVVTFVAYRFGTLYREAKWSKALCRVFTEMDFTCFTFNPIYWLTDSRAAGWFMEWIQLKLGEMWIDLSKAVFTQGWNRLVRNWFSEIVLKYIRDRSKAYSC